jgi:hypothetical protein
MLSTEPYTVLNESGNPVGDPIEPDAFRRLVRRINDERGFPPE